MGAIDQSGFEIMPDVIDDHTLSLIVGELTASKILRSRAGMRHALQLRSIWRLATGTLLMPIASSVLGKSAVPFRATLFDKSSRSNWLVVWHQDTALPLESRTDLAGWGPWSIKEGVICGHAPASALERILAIRVHLDESDDSNGPLRVLPGTHTMGVLTDARITELTHNIVQVECHVARGGVLLMKPLLVHASSKAVSESLRRVVHIEYATSLLLGGGKLRALRP
jgi:ectoine hydroxylase-related dioxygenase (phytanoyl-CoA dioxygenase family)